MKPRTRAQLRAEVVEILEAAADSHRVVRDTAARGLAYKVRTSGRVIAEIMQELKQAGIIDELVPANGPRTGVYRLLNGEVLPVVPVAIVPPACPECGIEAVTRMVADRNYLGECSELPVTAISLPRVRFLESAA